MSKVSLLTPVFNGEAYLQNWSQYIVNQTYDNVEIIVINDGSTDRTEELLNMLKPTFARRNYDYKIINQKNSGAAGAINCGLKSVTGDYIMLYDCDDVLMKDAIKEKADFLDNNPQYGMVRNNGYHVKAKNIGQNSFLFIRNRSEKQKEHIFEDILFGKTNNWSGSYMIRSQCLWESLGGRDIYVSPWGQNLQIMLPVAYHFLAGFVDKQLMRYVDYGCGISRTHSYEASIRMIRGYEENRIEILKGMKMPDNEKKQYIEKVKIMYNHLLLKVAMEQQKYNDAEAIYHVLKKTHDDNLTDWIYYIASKRRVCSKGLKFINHMKLLLVRIYLKAEGKIFRHDEMC